MSLPHLSPEELLTTTRLVRKRLDFSRPVPSEVIRECLELAVQALTGASSESWHFVVVTDQEQRKALGAIYRKGYQLYRQKTASAHPLYEGRSLPPEHRTTLKKVRSSSEYLADHIDTIPLRPMKHLGSVLIAQRLSQSTAGAAWKPICRITLMVGEGGLPAVGGAPAV